METVFRREVSRLLDHRSFGSARDKGRLKEKNPTLFILLFCRERIGDITTFEE